MAKWTKMLLATALGTLMIAPMASARGRVVIGGFWGPGWYGPGWSYGWYGPGPVWGYGYAPRPSEGSIKFDTKAKDAGVYVDGGYAGTVAQLKTFHLRPGNHQLELRSPDGHTFYQEQVNVIAGKTLTIHP